MPKMTAAEAAERVMEREGVDMAFGIPGAEAEVSWRGVESGGCDSSYRSVRLEAPSS